MTKLKRRFRRPFPLAFLVLAILAFVGGALYAPNNYDALAYRMPRVLHWLAEGRWHWIHTEFPRLNTRATAFEWLSAPWLALVRTDRFLFLINIVSLLLLPGLVFSVFHRLGVRGRVAWHWMWLVSSGYCFVLQAGSIGNDLFPAPFVLAAMLFALRAREGERHTDLWLSILAAALFTGVKANTLPLLSVWVVLAVPCWRLRMTRVVATLLVVSAAVGASFIPTGILNWKYCGDWTGARIENVHFTSGKPWSRVVGNALLISLQNFTPPVMPFAKSWNEHVATRAPKWVEPDFAAPDKIFRLDELQIEEGAGLGFGASVLLAVSIVTAIRAARRNGEQMPKMTRDQMLVIGATSVALAAFMQASLTGSAARLLTPYYPLLLMPFLIHPGHRYVVNRRWWRVGATTASALAAVLLVVDPARPLFPAQGLLKMLQQNGGSGWMLDRAERVYSVYGMRADGFAPARKILPVDIKVLGVITFDDPEASLWRPFGHLKIEHVTPSDSALTLQRRGIEYVLVQPYNLQLLFHQTLDQWAQAMHAEFQAKVSLDLKAAIGPRDWFLMKLPPFASE